MRTSSLLTVAGIAFLGALTPGCYNWRAGVSQTASLQHNCPAEQITVIADNGDEYSRVVQLEVCGQRRVYQDMGGRSGYAWIDTTPATSGAEAQPAQPQHGAPAVAPSQGIAVTAESPFAASVRAHIASRAAAIMTCTGGAVAIEARWVDTGVVQLGARGVTDPSTAQCIGAAIGAIEVPPGTAPGQLLHPISG